MVEIPDEATSERPATSRRAVRGNLPERIRFGEEDRLPFYAGAPMWILVLRRDWSEECFTASGTGFDALLAALKRKPKRVYAVWHGQHRTDLFDCDPVVLKKALRGAAKRRYRWQPMAIDPQGLGP